MSEMPLAIETERQIIRLIYSYSEFVDAGRFEDMAELFRNGRRSASGIIGREDVGVRGVMAYLNSLKVYADGTPRTKHIITNITVDIVEPTRVARSRCHYQLLQATESLPLQCIAAGRYSDQFECVSGAWRFVERVSYLDFLGDVTHHVPERWIPEMKRLATHHNTDDVPTLNDVLNEVPSERHQEIHRLARNATLLGLRNGDGSWTIEAAGQELCIIRR
jgi:3-phenylpropionate/cinnamic acid dioxygenase small subunit